MRLLFTSIIIFAFFSGVRAQKTLQLDIQNTGDENFNTKGFGVNGGRMFYQIVEKSTGVIPQEIIDDFVDLPQMVYRFPGGATANFYHYKKGKLHGYGFDRTEVTLVDDPIFCNFESPSQYCIEDDSLSQQNFVFNMLELAEAVFNKNGVKLQMLYVPNMLTFMVNDTAAVSYTHLRAHETVLDLVCRLLLEKKKVINTTMSLYYTDMSMLNSSSQMM